MTKVVKRRYYLNTIGFYLARGTTEKEVYYVHRRTVTHCVCNRNSSYRMQNIGKTNCQESDTSRTAPSQTLCSMTRNHSGLKRQRCQAE
ncbi:hypothetical protein TNCV_3445531 [Trichonephila clavipes]|nr:hypothetical protein TNCV_3445531 [Trichonephila clavipes]